MQAPRVRLLRAALDGGDSLLLFDNNVATFKTLAAGKAALQPPHQVWAAATSVHRPNIAESLRGEPQAEGLVAGWQTVLDFAPMSDYLTAFATWGTSEKTRELHSVFGTTPTTLAARGDAPGRAIPLKVCRAHNQTDFDTLYAAGVRMFGVHAVASDRDEYDRAQRVLGATIEEGTAGLPVASGEVASIRRMVHSAPDDAVFVLVVERALDHDSLRGLLRAYGMGAEAVSLQVQAHLPTGWLAGLGELGFRSVIIAVGAHDPRLQERLADLAQGPTADLVLLVDFSTHQPHLIDGSPESSARRTPAEVRTLVGRWPGEVMIASDEEPDAVLELACDFESAGVRVIGFDTQNGVEVPREQWRYRLIDDVPHLVRKCPDKIEAWRRALIKESGSKQ